MKKKLLQYGISTVVGAAIALWVMNMEGLFDFVDLPVNVIFMILCDAFFVAGILLALFGALVWISTTGFFDTFGFAIRTAAHLLFPFFIHDTKTFYDYKTEKAEKRGETKGFLVVVGVGYLLISIVFLILWMLV